MTGSFQHYQIKANKQNSLLCAPSLELQYALSPKSEKKLVCDLQNWWSEHEPLKLWGHPVLFLKGLQQLSHPYFSLKRLHLAIKDLIIISRDQGNIIQLMELGFEGQVQENWSPSKNECSNYLINLKQAHHNMEARGCWIPSAQAITNNEQHLWQNASHDAYQEWLEQITAWSNIRFLNHTTSPVWINNWEGHYHWWASQKKPKRKPIYATKINDNCKTLTLGKCQARNIALLVHGFYLEELEYILKRLPPGGNKEGFPGLDIYLSTTSEQFDEARSLLEGHKWANAYIFAGQNRGRDIAPFLLHQLPAAIKTGHKHFVKVHTKKSPQLHQGSTWGHHLITSLINLDFLRSLDEELSDPSIALLAPKGSLMPSSVELRQNSDHLAELLKSQKIDPHRILKQPFIAGSMMAGKIQSIKDLVEIKVSMNDFELECGQTDGTLAHAIERLLSWTATNKGLKIREAGQATNLRQGYGYGWVDTPAKNSTSRHSTIQQTAESV